MFTGLIEDVGSLAQRQILGRKAKLTIETALPLAEISPGDSIAVNGACLTVESKTGNSFTVSCLAETLARTNLKDLSAGSPLNLERALTAGGRLDGHLVQGHVDFAGKLIASGHKGEDWELEVEIPGGMEAFFVEKGSVAVNGVSLTIAKLHAHSFAVCIIPHTASHTNLFQQHTGDRLNIETDILGKYVQRILSLQKNPPATDDSLIRSLKSNGFLP